MSDNPEHLVLDSVDSPARDVWISTLLKLLSPPEPSLNRQLTKDEIHEINLHRAHCHVACNLFSTEHSPLDVFTRWDEFLRQIHLSELGHIRDYVASIDTTGLTEHEQEGQERARRLIDEVINFTQYGLEGNGGRYPGEEE